MEDLGSLLACVLSVVCGGCCGKSGLHSDLSPEDGVSRGAELFPLFQSWRVVCPVTSCPGVSETQAVLGHLFSVVERLF